MAADLGEGTFELVRGEMVEVPPPMPEHGRVCVNAAIRPRIYGRQSGYGYCLVQRLGRADRARPRHGSRRRRLLLQPRSLASIAGRQDLPPVPPDLAVEVVSPSNRPGEMQQESRANTSSVGVSLVWVVYPGERSVAIHRPDDEPPLVLARTRRHRKPPRAARFPLSRVRLLRLSPGRGPDPRSHEHPVPRPRPFDVPAGPGWCWAWAWSGRS